MDRLLKLSPKRSDDESPIFLDFAWERADDNDDFVHLDYDDSQFYEQNVAENEGSQKICFFYVCT